MNSAIQQVNHFKPFSQKTTISSLFQDTNKYIDDKFSFDDLAIILCIPHFSHQSTALNKSNYSIGIQRLNSLRSLKKGWAGEGSVPPSKQAFLDTSIFLAMLPPNVGVPTITPADDGEIVLEWRTQDKALVVGIEGDGEFGYTMLVKNKFLPGTEDGLINEGKLPIDLVNYLIQMR